MKWHLGEILVQKKWISWEQLEEVLLEQKKTRELIGEILIRKGYLSESLLYLALAEQSHLRFVSLKRVRINPEALGLMTGSFVKSHHLIPIEYHRGKLTVGVPSPTHRWPDEELKRAGTVREIQSVLCTPGDIEDAITEYYGGRK